MYFVVVMARSFSIPSFLLLLLVAFYVYQYLRNASTTDYQVSLMPYLSSG